MRLDAGSVIPFIIGYLGRMKDIGELRNGRVQLRLGERILTVAESGGSRAPVTPLLVSLFIDSALRRVSEGWSLDSMPEDVPEVFIDYLRRLNSSQPKQAGFISDEMFIRAAQIVASVSVGKNLVPQDFSPSAAAEALAHGKIEIDVSALIDRLISSGLVERRMPGGHVVLRFSLDPVAEYLAAIHKLLEMKENSFDEWKNYISSIEGMKGYPKAIDGYLTALATCYRIYKKDFSLPDIHFPWEMSRTYLKIA
jgi:hypothetical protein